MHRIVLETLFSLLFSSGYIGGLYEMIMIIECILMVERMKRVFFQVLIQNNICCDEMQRHIAECPSIIQAVFLFAMRKACLHIGCTTSGPA